MSDILTFRGEIAAKPRMTGRDKWIERPATSKYWAFKDHLTLTANVQGFIMGESVEMKIYLPMPKSWSKKKREEMHMKPHRQKPDLDNIIKSAGDILLPKDDSGIWNISATKHWTNEKEGTLIIRNL